MEFSERPVDKRDGYGCIEQSMLDAAASRRGCDLAVILQDENTWIWCDWLTGTTSIELRFTYTEFAQLSGTVLAQLNMGTDLHIVRACLFSHSRSIWRGSERKDLQCGYGGLWQSLLTLHTNHIVTYVYGEGCSTDSDTAAAFAVSLEVTRSLSGKGER